VTKQDVLPIYGELALSSPFDGADTGRPTLEELLAQLEASITQLAVGTAPLEELVATHQRAVRLLAQAQAQLDELKGRAEQTAKLLSE
jgi:exodeoxyribonuclease VII small subunit